MNINTSEMTPLRFVEADMWEAVSRKRYPCPYPPFSVYDAVLGKPFTIRPGISLHDNLVVLGGDWIPYRPDGLAVIDQMTHTPSLYVTKARNLQVIDGHCYAAPARLRNLPEDVVLVGSSPNYYHWLIDHLPRLLLVRKLGLLDGRKVLVGSGLQSFQLDALRMLGVDADQLLYMEPDEAVQFRSVLVPNLLSATTVCHPLVRELLLEAFPAVHGNSQRSPRIYLSREDAATRRLTNEAQAVALLEHAGFEKYVLTDKPFQEQIDLFRHAEAVVAVHGAGMANTIFCTAGCRVVEIFSPLHKVSSMQLIAHVAGLRHSFVPAEVTVPSADGNPLLGQWQVDLPALASELR